jgi:peptide/nickel transport system substrate-binding protein
MRRIRDSIVTSIIALAASVTLTSCGVSAAASTKTPLRTTAPAIAGGTVRYAEPVGGNPNYIFPVDPSVDATFANLSWFQNLLYKPLYVASLSEPTINYSRSIGNRPVWSDGDRVITITLKHYRWSDGTPVTARDVTFFINLARAAGTNWGYYSPGNMPYNIEKITIDSEYKLTITLKSPYNPIYYTDNQLLPIVPLPQNLWDRESLHGRVGNYDLTPAGAKRVFNFLNSYAEKTSTYSSNNPIWSDVDGPYRLLDFGGSTTADVFIPNRDYSGHRSTIARFMELPFTSGSAEYDSLRSGDGAITVGYVPAEDVPTLATVRRAGYSITAVPSWGLYFMMPNLTNPELGAVFRQLYVRQVLQHLVDEPAMVRYFLHGFGVPTYGPSPLYPKGNPFADRFESSNPYPYSVTDAKRLLATHGWKVIAGVETCIAPESCGKGVRKGTKLDIKLLFESGSTSVTDEIELFQSDAHKVGINITPLEESFNTVVGIEDPCTPGVDGVTATSAVCTWQLGTYGEWGYSLFPSFGQLFLPGAAGNSGSYDNPALNALILDVRHSSSLASYYAAENMIARDLPWIWLPSPSSIAAVANDLVTGPGVVPTFGNLAPNRWYFIAKH